jgi:hypothetical protein
MNTSTVVTVSLIQGFRNVDPHNAGVTGRFVERQRNKAVMLTHLLKVLGSNPLAHQPPQNYFKFRKTLHEGHRRHQNR